jgi:hypothetical protein
MHAEFLVILPRIEVHAKIVFRHLKCPGKKADAIAETLAVAWKWYRGIIARGKDVNAFVSTLASLAVRHVRCGRKLCGQEPGKDMLSPLAQRRHGFQVESLPNSTNRSHEALYGDPCAQRKVDAFEERLHDNVITPPPDQAAFRLDYPRWLSQLIPHKRAIADDMALDHTTQELACKHKLSQGRISQLRRELHRNWLHFHGEEVP